MKNSIAALLLLLTTSPAWAQNAIIITEQEYLSGLGSLNNQSSFVSQDVTGLQALVTSSGANQTWNFGTRVWTAQSDSSTATLLTDPSSAPLSSNFPGATDVLKITPVAGTFNKATFYDFIKINASGFWTLGSVQDSLGAQSVLEILTPPEQEVAFPLTYGTPAWSSSSSIGSPKLPSGFTDSIIINTTVDGFGTLITPAAPSGVMALREKQETTSKLSYKTFGSVTRSFIFSWVTQGFDQATISADSNQKPTDATYSSGSSSGVRASNGSSDPSSLYLSQNPVSNTETTLYYTLESAGPVHVELIDGLGKTVRLLKNGIGSAGENIIPIDPATLSVGTYFIRVEANGTSAMQKLVIQ